MDKIIEINKEDVRAVKKDYNTDGRYWYMLEIRVKKTGLFSNGYKWQNCYLINKTTYKWDSFLDSMLPNEEGIVRWTWKCFYKINELLKNGFEIVDRKTFDFYVDHWRSIEINKNNIVYLK